jgi:ssDNA-binding Zn-finger/Zn-ribbon topoisomerase 1
MKNLFNKFFALFNLEVVSKEPEKTKSKDGERLTAWEKQFIWKSMKKDGTITCTNCEEAKMYEGPSGGMSTNIRCPKCGQGINFMLLPGRNDADALDWCDNIGISESWISDKYKKEAV